MFLAFARDSRLTCHELLRMSVTAVKTRAVRRRWIYARARVCEATSPDPSRPTERGRGANDRPAP